ncbi:cytochrome P450 [Pyrenochaeta sp. MPI-SDFR-AT-0127]|nr:cytochrome P450 [Pyrenochaeta sp. MPI-SDFR-AT-0127]
MDIFQCSDEGRTPSHIEDAEIAIPEPKRYPYIGHIVSIDSEFPLGSMKALADQYGEIYRLRFPGRTLVVVSTQALVNETCNEKRFKKSINSALNNIREGVHDGLFTAELGEENWGIAHRILMPTFGPLSIQGMFDDMHDIASQLTLKWARQGPDTAIPVTDDFTRLTLDTLAVCSMGYRFNSFYSPELHPFVEAMGDFLTEAGAKPRRLPLPSMFFYNKDQKYEADIRVMRDTAREVLKTRQAGQNDRHDLLSAMMKRIDSKTGKKMTDESIMDNLITFLVAGHETTSGLLSFVFYELLKHPEAMRRAQKEVDEVCGRGAIKVEHMTRLPYISAVLRETLRLNATIPLFTVAAFEDTTLGGRYPVKAGEIILNLLASSHLDPKVFGADSNEFRPERMLDEPFERIAKEFPNCWKPFGNGMRACIGRPFAWQESLLVLAMLLQTFNFVLDPDYSLRFKQTLTIKPKDMHMRAILRQGLDPTSLQHRLAGQSILKGETPFTATSGSEQGNKIPLTVLYGSDSGTCESLSQRLATAAASHGFRITKIDCLDSANGALPTEQPVLIITASYEGQPPDNARNFVKWMEGLEKSSQPLNGVSYSAFGCGNREWTQTFHRIPKLLDTKLTALGAKQVAALGLSDVSTGRVVTDFETWADDVFWPAMATRYDSKPEPKNDTHGLKVTISATRVSTLRQKLLTKDCESKYMKKHLEIRLPEDMTYKPGDYLVVLPFNPRENVHRVLRRFRLPWDAQLDISADGPITFPTNASVAAHDILSSYVELSQPATKGNLLILAASAKDYETESTLTSLANQGFVDEISAKRISVLDLLERFPNIDPSFATFLSMMLPMRVRQYSISSSPMEISNHATVTYSILHEPSFSGQGLYQGVASSYLSSLSEGDTVQIAVHKAHTGFNLPTEPEITPIICVAAGTGIAPFRGFMQERAAIRVRNKQVKQFNPVTGRITALSELLARPFWLKLLPALELVDILVVAAIVGVSYRGDSVLERALQWPRSSLYSVSWLVLLPKLLKSYVVSV